MKKLTANLIIFLILIVLLFQFTCVQAGYLSNSIQIDDDPNTPEEINETIIFFDSNDVSDANDPNSPEIYE